MKGLLNFLTMLLGMAFNAALLILTVYFIYEYAFAGVGYGRSLAKSISEERPYKEVELTLQDGATISEVAKLLEDNGIIGNALYYQLESVLKGSDDDFAGGTFKVNSEMDSNQLNYALRSVTIMAQDKKITIREGFTLSDIGDYLESQEIITKAEFVEACNTLVFTKYAFIYDIPERENRLEGYLFPDTYFISANADAEEIITKMLDRFAQIYTKEYAERAEEMGLTMDEVITIASIIEKEMRRDDERAKCAEVIYNRLDQGMTLGMCSTVLYVLDKRKEHLLYEDLEIKSPYNTYINAGLPIGPISNPGQKCIEAALNPSKGNLLYFVVMNEETGEHFFTHSDNEFINAKIRYNQKY